MMFLPSHLLKTCTFLFGMVSLVGVRAFKTLLWEVIRVYLQCQNFGSFFLYLLSFFWQEWDGKNTDRDTRNRKTETFVIDVSARPLHTRQLQCKFIRYREREDARPRARAKKLAPHDPNAGLPNFWPPQMDDVKGPNKKSAKLHQGSILKQKQQQKRYCWKGSICLTELKPN